MAAELNETQVRDNFFVWTLGGETMQTAYGTNAVGVLSRSAVLVVDPLIAPAYGRLILDAVRRHTRAPVRFVVFTHHHTDHTLGAAAAEDAGAVLIAHRACRERMDEEHAQLITARKANADVAELFADARPVPPAVPFDEGLILHVGDVEVEVWHPGWCHTPGDAFLYLPAERVAVCGDLVFAGYHYNYEDASLSGVREGLRALHSLDADVFIPGHGAPGGPEILQSQAVYHETVETIVRSGVAAGQDDGAVGASVRERFPDHRLGVVTQSAATRVREHLAKHAATSSGTRDAG
ncbi:MAG: MBL fold metallo-hydrolase [bacterium]